MQTLTKAALRRWTEVSSQAAAVSSPFPAPLQEQSGGEVERAAEEKAGADQVEA